MAKQPLCDHCEAIRVRGNPVRYHGSMDVYFEQHKPTSSVANYLSQGAKKPGNGTLGLELEHFVVEQGSHHAVPFAVPEGSSAPSVQAVLEGIRPHYDKATVEQGTDGRRYLFGLARDKAVITLEPGAQLEISIGPAASVGELDGLYTRFRTEVDAVLELLGLELVTQGYHPTSCAHERELLPKHRYQYMDRTFQGTGKHGICMMRATASTQVSVDYFDEQDALLKLRVANALGPFFAFITDNTPVFEGERVGVCGGTAAVAKSGLAVPFRMARMVCWDDTDPLRSLVVRGAFDNDFSFRQYAATLMDAPAVFLPPAHPGEKTPYLGPTPFKKTLPDSFISKELVLHILSLFFFDVRFKSYLEIRQADSLPAHYALSYAALISGIFYNPRALAAYDEYFKYCDAMAVARAKTALRGSGYAAEVYGRPATEWLDELFAFAAEGLEKAELPYLAPLATLVATRQSLLDKAATRQGLLDEATARPSLLDEAFLDTP